MKFGKLLAGAILAVSAVGANAATYGDNQAINLKGGATGVYGNAFNFAGAAGNDFVDTYTFSIAAPSDLSSSLTSFASARTKATSNLDITAVNLWFNGVKVGSGVEFTEGENEEWLLDIGNLSSGAYTLEVAGLFEGSKGGSYAGEINVSPVPEPATWGMLGLGLAAVGFAARRKQAK